MIYQRFLNGKVETDEIIKENVTIDVPKESIAKNESEPDWKNEGSDLRELRDSNFVVRETNL